MEFIDLDGVRLECQWTGPARNGAPVLVFLHEGLGSVSLWRDFPGQMAEVVGLPAFVYSRQGYGGSSPVALPRPLDYLEREGRDVLPRVLDRAGIASAILVGHSDGASIALVHAAADRSGRVKGVVAMAPHTFVEDVCIAAIARVRDVYADHLRARLEPYHGANIDCAFHGWNDTWLNPGFRAMDLRPLLPSITVPTLVIQGERDEYATAAQVDEVAQRVAGPVRALMLPECGHAPYRDRPDEVKAAIAELVRPLSG